MTVSVILVPYDESQELITHFVSWDTNHSIFEYDIAHLLNPQCGQDYHFETTPLLRPRSSSGSSSRTEHENYKAAGLYAYFHIPSPQRHTHSIRNVRATRLAMACGLHSLRFYGPVVLVRSVGCSYNFMNLSINEIWGACCISPDLRHSILHDIASTMGLLKDGNTDNNNNGGGGGGIEVPEWLADAAQQNYHDEAELNKVISAMNPPDECDIVDDNDEDEIDDEDSDDNVSGGSDDEQNIRKENTKMRHSVVALSCNSRSITDTNNTSTTTEFVAKTPLCIHCRRSSTATNVLQLCNVCEGVYFCSKNKCCKEDGWSHDCLCLTWSIYTRLHRHQLSTFTNNTFGRWQTMLTSRSFQLSETPYETFIHSLLLGNEVEDSAHLLSSSSWWCTEMGGWSGGQSTSASHVDFTTRMSYKQGFAPIVDIPEECRIVDDHSLSIRKNGVGLLTLSSWQDYYTLRNIPPSSPVCLLLTFPLTIYHAIEKYGEVPVTVARMLNRPLRIHVVGAEKEINFLDMFKEVMFLLPEDIQLELVFVVREDMFPAKCRQTAAATTTTNQSSSKCNNFSYKIEYETMTIMVVSGTYGSATLDPKFDIGTGPPDMIIGLNAGLYAYYESWRFVINYLHNSNNGIVGVFTDYNEYSGVNCAALGGGRCRDSLCMNPFRQPRAMPVYSMNLPQFSNGFIYVFNEQEIR